MVNALSVEELSLHANGQTLLDNVSFELAMGERKGLIGASGCGKSLSASAICGLLRPPLFIASGRIILDGRNILDFTQKEWRAVRGRHIFQIFQSPGTALTLAMRIGPQLLEAAEIAGVKNSKRTVLKALHDVELDEAITEFFPYQLSGGMKQRVLIAMALILRPRILIADEPTTGLDVLTEFEILSSLNTMIEETGASLLFISHDLRVVRNVAQRTLVMHEGRIVEETQTDMLMQSSHQHSKSLAKAAASLVRSC